MKFEKSILDNGLTIITVEDKDSNICNNKVFVNAGSRNELEKEHGIAHFLEHMLFKGTTNRTAKEIVEEIDCLGGYFNASTSYDYTVYYNSLLKKDIEKGIEILADLVQNPLFDETEFEKEKNVIIQEINMYQDISHEAAIDYFQEATIKGTLGRKLVGFKETIENSTTDDLKNFMKRNCTADNMALVVSGNIKHENIVALAEKYFDKLPKENTKFEDKSLPKGQSFIEFRENQEQSHFILGFTKEIDLSKKPLKEIYAEKLFNSILSSGMSSRFFQEIREKHKLCYTVETSISYYKDCQVFNVYCGTTEDKLQLLCDELKNQFNKIRQIEVDEKELNKVKNKILYGIENLKSSSESLAGFYIVNYFKMGKIINIDEVVETIKSITTKDIKTAAIEILSNTQSMTVVGSAKTLPKFEL